MREIKRRVKCKHFDGPIINDFCEAQVNYRLLVGGPNEGWYKRTPCIQGNETNVVCERQQFPTPEELRDREEKLRKRYEALRDALIAINAQRKLDGKLQGVIECPACKGVLAYTISSGNGHIWGLCRTTEGCLSWMQ